MTSEFKQTLGGAFARIMQRNKMNKIELEFFKSQCNHHTLNYEMGKVIKAVDVCERQSSLILSDKSKAEIEYQLDDERLLKLMRIFQLISPLDNNSLDLIETQFEEALKQQP